MKKELRIKMSFSNRGRFQAQGRFLEESEAWSKNEDFYVTEAITLLGTLESSLCKSDSELRKREFLQARNYVNNAQYSNGAYAEIKKTFRVKNTKSERVDVEVRAGRAFLKDPEVKK